MKKIIISLTFVITLFSAIYAFSSPIKLSDEEIKTEKILDPKYTLYIELKDGIVIAELFPNTAPMHVQRIRTLTADNFYDNVKFHRVISNFMAQTGDPTGTGRGGSNLGRLYAEFNNEHHIRGTLSMARASDINSANSQFFIVTGEFFPELDKQYTIFGRVIEGMENVDKIKAGDSAKNGMVDNPDVMIKVITGDMLNNKPLETIKEEIKVINDLQNEKLKSEPNYKKKSVLELLLQTKDININQTGSEPAVIPNANTVPENKTNGVVNQNTGTTNGDKIKNGTIPSANSMSVNTNNSVNNDKTNNIVNQDGTRNNNSSNPTTNTNTPAQQNNNINGNINEDIDFNQDTIPTPYEGNIE